MRNRWIALSVASLAAGLGCTGGSLQPADGTANISVRISGGSPAPSLSLVASESSRPGTDLIASATVEIGAVQLVPACGDGPPGEGACEADILTLTETGGTYDLLDLQSGVNATLATATVPAGSYSQLRLVVLSAAVTLVDGVTFTDGSTSANLTVPSGARSGIKILLNDRDGEPGLTVGEGEIVVLLELDVTRNFVLTGPPGRPYRALFTPVVRQVEAT
jgi:hypothetical protein